MATAAAGRAARPDRCRRTASYAAAEPPRLHAARSRDGGGDAAGGPMSCCAPAAPWVRGAIGSPAIIRTVCAALSRATRQALAAEPAWVTANGTITSNDVAHAPPGHPPRGGRRLAVPQRHLAVRPGRRGTPSHRHGRLRRQRRRRPCPGPGRGHPHQEQQAPRHTRHRRPPPASPPRRVADLASSRPTPA